MQALNSIPFVALACASMQLPPRLAQPVDRDSPRVSPIRGLTITVPTEASLAPVKA